MQAQVEGEVDITTELRRPQVVQVPDVVEILDRASPAVAENALGAGRTCQVRIEGKLHAFLAYIVNISATQEMGRGLPGRVETVVLAADVHALDMKLRDTFRDIRGKSAAEIGKASGPRTVALFEHLDRLVEDDRKSLQIPRRQRSPFGVDPGVAHRGAHRQRLAVAVVDHATVDGNGDLADGPCLTLFLEEVPLGDGQVARAAGKGNGTPNEEQHHDAVANGGWSTLHGSTVAQGTAQAPYAAGPLHRPRRRLPVGTQLAGSRSPPAPPRIHRSTRRTRSGNSMSRSSLATFSRFR